MASQIQTINQSEDLSPIQKDVGESFVGLPESLRRYARELERRVDILVPYWERKKSRISVMVELTRENSLYEHIRSTGQYHQTRLLRLLNVAREVQGYPKISQRAFTIWLNRFEKRRRKPKH